MPDSDVDYRWSSVVCLSVGHVREPCKYCSTDRDAIWRVTHGGPRNHISQWDLDPHEMGNFGGCPTHWKALRVSAAVYAGKWIIQSSITAWQRDYCSRLQCSQLIIDWLSSGFTSHPTQSRSFRRRSSQPISWLRTEKLKQIQQKQTCIRNKIYYNIKWTKKLKPGLIASYDLQPGHRTRLFWKK